MYLLKMCQWEKNYDIGIFESEQSIYQFINKIPFVKKENENLSYYMNFKDIPNYFEVEYNNYLYIISKFSFDPSGGEIFFSFGPIHYFDQRIASEKTMVKGETIVDAYCFSNQEVKHYIREREALFEACQQYYQSKGLEVKREAIGSEDGEYVQLKNGPILFLLDPQAVEIWEQSKNIEECLSQLIEEI